jgi:hypothetical protein
MRAAQTPQAPKLRLPEMMGSDNAAALALELSLSLSLNETSEAALLRRKTKHISIVSYDSNMILYKHDRIECSILQKKHSFENIDELQSSMC